MDNKTLQKVEILRKRLERLKKEFSELEGEEKGLLKRLDEEFGIKTIIQGEKEIEKLESEIEDEEEKLEILIEKLKEKLDLENEEF